MTNIGSLSDLFADIPTTFLYLSDMGMLTGKFLFFYGNEKWFLYHFICLSLPSCSLPSTGIIAVSKIALHFSVLKTDERTGSRLQSGLKYESSNVSFFKRLTDMFEYL